MVVLLQDVLPALVQVLREGGEGGREGGRMSTWVGGRERRREGGRKGRATYLASLAPLEVLLLEPAEDDRDSTCGVLA